MYYIDCYVLLFTMAGKISFVDVDDPTLIKSKTVGKKGTEAAFLRKEHTVKHVYICWYCLYYKYVIHRHMQIQQNYNNLYFYWYLEGILSDSRFTIYRKTCISCKECQNYTKSMFCFCFLYLITFIFDILFWYISSIQMATLLFRFMTRRNLCKAYAIIY